MLRWLAVMGLVEVLCLCSANWLTEVDLSIVSWSVILRLENSDLAMVMSSMGFHPLGQPSWSNFPGFSLAGGQLVYY
jgi:hypothetical protein